jgi:hypothetical protein|eukprot:COSAG01_NODE_139_length_24311_cov_75.405873_6_plen_111_part_00
MFPQLTEKEDELNSIKRLERETVERQRLACHRAGGVTAAKSSDDCPRREALPPRPGSGDTRVGAASDGRRNHKQSSGQAHRDAQSSGDQGVLARARAMREERRITLAVAP